MPWIQTSPSPPDHTHWLKCDICGWLALLTQGNIHASAEGDACKYCSNPLRLATPEDMREAYPEGQFEWVEDDVIPQDTDRV